MKANNILNSIRNQFQDNEYLGGIVALDNEAVIEQLNGEAVEVKDILDQETWVMADGSYITRSDDVYWTGNDVTDFELTESLSK